MTLPWEPHVFRDSVGVTWTVREIASPSMPPKLEALLGEDRRTGGWLLFQSEDGERRRLAPYPADWRKLSASEIERWCMRAVRVPPAPERRGIDRDPRSGG